MSSRHSSLAAGAPPTEAASLCCVPNSAKPLEKRPPIKPLRHMIGAFSPSAKLNRGPRDRQIPPRMPQRAMEVALLTGGFDRPYAFGLATALASDSVVVDVVGSDEVDSPEMHSTPGLRFLNFRRKNHTTPGFAQKTWRVLVYYVRLIRYVITARPTIFHILWNNKIQWFDRTFLMLYYKACGKQITITVHNVNAGKRDGNDSLVNRLTLRAQYDLADHLFVHTAQMKRKLSRDFGVSEGIISVIPFGINNSVPEI